VSHDLEYPGAPGAPDWSSLYRSRGDEVVHHRPIFTGDVFENVRVQGLAQVRTKNVLLLQHPCALRSNGVDLHPRLMVAEVRQHRVISAEEWTGHLSKMPLPDLKPAVASGRRNQAAFFDEPYLVGPDDLDPQRRVACLAQTGVNLLLQRWVHHNSRAVVPTATYQDVSSPAFEEADLIEEWVEERLEAGLDMREATIEAVKWLREDAGVGLTRQALLENPQSRSIIRQQLRAALRRLQ
jgi:hypothetical protein